MKFHMLTLAALLPTLGIAQNDASETIRNALRAVKKAPAVTKDSEADAVRQAEQLFLKGKEKLESSELNTAENRAKAEQAAQTAVAAVTQAAEENSEAVAKATRAIEETTGTNVGAIADKIESVIPSSSSDRSDVPATRPANSNRKFLTPTSMPEATALAPLATTDTRKPVVQTHTIAPISSTEPTERRIPTTPGLYPQDVPAPKPLTPKFNPKAKEIETDVGDSLVIKSESAVMDEQNGLLTFSGNVFVDSPNPNAKIKCELLKIYINSNGSGASKSTDIKRIVATGGMVEIRRIGEGGKKQTALGKRAEYDQATGDFVLSGGPPYIQEGSNSIKTQNNAAKIIMRGNGKYEIENGRATVNFQVPKKSGSSNPSLGTGLGGILDSNR